MARRYAGTLDAAQPIMPYSSNAELPELIRRALPRHAQDIFRASFNEAYARYGPHNEDRIRHLAWTAVRREYAHHGARIWVPRLG